jgi:hypothetical protein
MPAFSLTTVNVPKPGSTNFPSYLQNSAAQTPEFPTEDAPRSGIEVI